MTKPTPLKTRLTLLTGITSLLFTTACGVKGPPEPPANEASVKRTETPAAGTTSDSGTLAQPTPPPVIFPPAPESKAPAKKRKAKDAKTSQDKQGQ